MTILTPPAVKKMCRMFIQDLNNLVSSTDELVLLVASNIEPDDAPVIATFLDKLLGGRYTPDEIKEWWWTTPSSIFFSDGRVLMNLLKLIRQALDRRPFDWRP